MGGQIKQRIPLTNKYAVPLPNYEGLYQYDTNLNMVWTMRRGKYLKTINKTVQCSKSGVYTTYRGVNVYDEHGDMHFLILERIQNGKLKQIYKI